jgi:hypothetical protein
MLQTTVALQNLHRLGGPSAEAGQNKNGACDAVSLPKTTDRLSHYFTFSSFFPKRTATSAGGRDAFRRSPGTDRSILSNNHKNKQQLRGK